MQTVEAAFHLQLPCDGKRVCSGAFSPDGTCIAIGTQTGQIFLFDAAASFQSLQASAPVSALVWSPDGRYLAATDSDHTVGIWDIMIGDRVESYAGHQRGIYRCIQYQVTALAWSPDGKRLASGSSDGSIEIWNARPATHMRTLTDFPSPTAKPVTALHWASNSRLISVTRASLIIWQDGKRVGEQELDSEVAALISRHDEGLLLACTDGTLRVWSQQARAALLASRTMIKGRFLALRWQEGSLLQALALQTNAVVEATIEIGGEG